MKGFQPGGFALGFQQEIEIVKAFVGGPAAYRVNPPRIDPALDDEQNDDDIVLSFLLLVAQEYYG